MRLVADDELGAILAKPEEASRHFGRQEAAEHSEEASPSLWQEEAEQSEEGEVGGVELPLMVDAEGLIRYDEDGGVLLFASVDVLHGVLVDGVDDLPKVTRCE